MRSFLLNTLVGFMCLSGAAVFSEARAADPSAKDDAKASKPVQQTLITISKETTRLTEPLTDDGFVDYLAAINAKESEGVTVENNAAVSLLRAFGPGEIRESWRDEYFKALGLNALPEQGEYVEQIGKFAERMFAPPIQGLPDAVRFDERFNKKRDALFEQQGQAMSKPWKWSELPRIAEWLKANEKPLEHIVEASRRSRYYTPYLSPGDDDDHYPLLISVLLPTAQESRTAARLLTARAMLHLGEGRVEEAQKDVLACHRLGRLVGSGPTLIEGLVGIALDAMAAKCDYEIAEHGNLTAAQAEAFRKEIAELPPLPDMAEKMDEFERLMYCDAVVYIARRGPDELFNSLGLINALSLVSYVQPPNGAGGNDAMKRFLMNAVVDWDVVLEIGNEWYDRMVAAARQPTRAERVAAMEQINEEIQTLHADMQHPKWFAKRLAVGFFAGKSARKVNGEAMGRVMVGLLLPAVSAATEAVDRQQQRVELAQLAYALAGCRADYSAYPDQLSDLAPKYIPAVPVDVYSAKPLIYQRQGDGYVLYSVGKNLKDDDDATFDSEPRGDDITVRTRSPRE